MNFSIFPGQKYGQSAPGSLWEGQAVEKNRKRKPALPKTIRKIGFSLLPLFFTVYSFGQEFIDGKIITLEQDTVPVKILKEKKKRKERINTYSFITILDSTGQEKKVFGNSLLGYEKEGAFYKAFHPKNLSGYPDGKGFFAKYLIRGKADLLHSPLWANEYAGRYVFKKKNERAYNVLEDQLYVRINNPRPVASVGGNPYGQSSGTAGTLSMESQEQAFREFFIHYFRDCPILVKKLRLKLHTSDDVPALFREYNEACR